MWHCFPCGFPTARRVLLAGLAVCAGATSLLTANSLVEHSPFLPPGYGVTKEPPKPVVTTAPTIISRQLEFKGLIELDGTTRFSVFDKKSNEGYWLTLNESAGDFEVIRYDEQRQSILVSSSGHTEELALATPDDTPMQITGSSPTRKGTSTPRTTISRASHSNNSSTRKPGPLIPRRRIVRPSSNKDSTNKAEKRTDTPSSPLPPVPSS